MLLKTLINLKMHEKTAKERLERGEGGAPRPFQLGKRPRPEEGDGGGF